MYQQTVTPQVTSETPQSVEGEWSHEPASLCCQIPRHSQGAFDGFPPQKPHARGGQALVHAARKTAPQGGAGAEEAPGTDNGERFAPAQQPRQGKS